MRKKLLGIVIVGLLLAPWALADQGGPPEAGMYDQVLGCFQAFLDDLKGAIDSLNAADQDLEARYQELAMKLRDAETTLSQLQKAVTLVSGQVDALESRLKNLVIEIHDDFARLEKLINENTQATQDLASELGAYKAEVEKKLNLLANQFTDALASMSKKYDGELTDILSKLSSHESRISALEKQDLGSLQRRILALEQATQALQIKIENSRAKIEGIEAALGGFTTDIQANKDALASLTARVNDQETRLTALETQVDGLDVKAVQNQLEAAGFMSLAALIIAVVTALAFIFGK